MYQRPLYADPFWGPPGPLPYRYGPGFGPYLYPRPFYYPPTAFSPFRPYPHPYRYGWYGRPRYYRY